MSSYRIDLEGSKADGVVLVKLLGRAQAETIVKLLNELNALAELDSSLRVLIDERPTSARGSSAQAISARSRRRGGRPLRCARSVPRRSPPTPSYTASTACFKVSRRESGAGERLQRSRAREGVAS